MGISLRKITRGISKATGLNLDKPLKNFELKNIERQLNPVKNNPYTRFVNGAEFVGQVGGDLGLKKAGRVKQSFPYGRPEEAPDYDEAGALEEARFNERKAKGKSSTLFSDEDTEEEANYSIARRRLMGF